MNIIAGIECPSVTARRYGPAFGWQDPVTLFWHMADDLPREIIEALPACEQERLMRHKARRMGTT